MWVAFRPQRKLPKKARCSATSGHWRYMLGPPVPFSPLFEKKGSPTKTDYRKNGYPCSNLSTGKHGYAPRPPSAERRGGDARLEVQLRSLLARGCVILGDPACASRGTGTARGFHGVSWCLGARQMDHGFISFWFPCKPPPKNGDP